MKKIIFILLILLLIGCSKKIELSPNITVSEPKFEKSLKMYVPVTADPNIVNCSIGDICQQCNAHFKNIKNSITEFLCRAVNKEKNLAGTMEVTCECGYNE